MKPSDCRQEDSLPHPAKISQNSKPCIISGKMPDFGCEIAEGCWSCKTPALEMPVSSGEERALVGKMPEFECDVFDVDFFASVESSPQTRDCVGLRDPMATGGRSQLWVHSCAALGRKHFQHTCRPYLHLFPASAKRQRP